MSDLKMKRFVQLMSFVAICMVALALILQLIFKAVGVDAGVINAIRIVGECIAYLVVCATAFGYIRSKRNTVWTIIYAVCVTIIVVLIILR